MDNSQDQIVDVVTYLTNVRLQFFPDNLITELQPFESTT